MYPYQLVHPHGTPCSPLYSSLQCHCFISVFELPLSLLSCVRHNSRPNLLFVQPSAAKRVMFHSAYALLVPPALSVSPCFPMVMSKHFTWLSRNVRRLGQKDKCDAVIAELLQVALQETKLSSILPSKLHDFLPSRLSSHQCRRRNPHCLGPSSVQPAGLCNSSLFRFRPLGHGDRQHRFLAHKCVHSH